MPDALWKACERKIAKLLGGQRNPVGMGLPDVSTPVFSIQVKERKRLGNFLKEAMIEAEAECEQGKLAIVILHEKGKRYEDSLVQIRLKDFIEWYGG